mgnify:CR=1 FL=1
MSSKTIRRKRALVSKARQNSLALVLAVLVLASVFILVLFLNNFNQTVRITGIVITSVSLLVFGFFLFRILNLMPRYQGTLEKQTTAKLSKTEGKYKALIQNSLDLITILDSKGNIIYQSPSAERVLGYKPEELVNQPIFELIHSEDHALLKNVLQQKSSNFFFSYRMQHHDGTWMYFEAAGTNLHENPLVNGIVVNSRDISDRKKEEEARRQKEVAAIRSNLAKERTEEEKRIIEESKKELEKAYGIIEHKNQEITDSITYAFRIQTALLPSVENIKEDLPNSFVLWKPKDIVSGDFYWFAQKGPLSIIAAADCTGHGVPGAFMTMIGNTLLNRIILELGVTMPNEILEMLHKGVRNALRQDQTDSKDGMDISFMVINRDTQTLYWSGANNPLIRIREGDFEEFKADKQAIGGSQDEDERKFTLHELAIEKGDKFYVYSDGYQDQFGGPRGRKFMTKKFKKLLAQISDDPVDSQKETLDKTMQEWMGEKYEQIDDIIVIGVKF